MPPPETTEEGLQPVGEQARNTAVLVEGGDVDLPDLADPPPGGVVAPAAEAVAAPSEPERVVVSEGSKAPRHRKKRSHRVLTWSVVAVVLLAMATGGWVAAQRINRPLSRPVLHSELSSSEAVTGSSPVLPWPGKGQGAIAIPSLGYAQQSGPELPVPIASLTKLATAVVVLNDHPVPAGAGGPAITVTAADVAEYDAELHLDESTVAIQLGEVLTERQMLEALLTQSANDIAYGLAVWDAGTEPAFVVKMNAMAASLGATSSHFVDASGYDPHSVSTAADCLRIASAGMADPAFAEVVAMPTVTLPLVGTVHNIVSEVGSNGVVGIKSGYTSEAGGCLVLAGNRIVQGRPVVVLVAVLGQPVPPPIIPTTTTTSPPPPPPTATTAPPAPPTGLTPPTASTAPPPTAPPVTSPPPPPTTTIPLNDLTVPDPLRFTRPVAEALLNAAEAAVVVVTVSKPGTVVAAVASTWGGMPHRVPVVTSRGAWLLAWPGQTVSSAAEYVPVAPGGGRGIRVGTALFALGAQIQLVPLALATTVPEPSWWWRLVHRG